jgi:uncharacterized coiled-coil DUF342 family protein
VAEIALWNKVNEAHAKVEEAQSRLDQLAPLVHEQDYRIKKLEGELKALKARMGKVKE